jgi:hypothetical protein
VNIIALPRSLNDHSFCGKDAMDIRSFGAANVQKFYELGF